MRLKARSRASSCSPLKVVLERRCFRLRIMPGSDSVSLSSPEEVGPGTNEMAVNNLDEY